MDYAHLKQITLASAIAVACTLPIAEDAWAPVFAKYDGVPAAIAEELMAKVTGSKEKLAV